MVVFCKLVLHIPEKIPEFTFVIYKCKQLAMPGKIEKKETMKEIFLVLL